MLITLLCFDCLKFEILCTSATPLSSKEKHFQHPHDLEMKVTSQEAIQTQEQ